MSSPAMIHTSKFLINESFQNEYKIINPEGGVEYLTDERKLYVSYDPKKELDEALEEIREHDQFEKMVYYLYRDQAVARSEERRYIPGTMTSDKWQIEKKDLKEAEERVKLACENGSVMWLDVFSFNNDFLEEIGIYDSETDYLIDTKIKQATQKAMEKINDLEGYQDLYWLSSIHRNTDNIHVHVLSVEETPSRKIIVYKDQEQSHGSRRKDYLNDMKMAFGNQLMDMSEYWIELSDLRDRVRKGYEHYLLVRDSKVNQMMNEMDREFPEKWEKKVQYNHFSYKRLTPEQKERVDAFFQEMILEEDGVVKENYQAYFDQLQLTDEQLKKLYGEVKDETTSVLERKEDLKERLGNVTLKSLGSSKRKFNEEKKKRLEKKDRARDRLSGKSRYRKRTALEKTAWAFDKKTSREVDYQLRRNLSKEKHMARQRYQEMMEDVERS